MESLNGGVGGGVTSSSSKSEEDEKAASPYTYWVRNKTEAAAPLPVPQKLQQQSSSSESQSPHQLGSGWNRAGTWEEKSLNHWAIPRIKVNLFVTTYTSPLSLSNYSFISLIHSFNSFLFQELLISVGSISFSSRGTAQVEDVTKCV